MPAKRNLEISKPALLGDEVDTSHFIKVVVELPNSDKNGNKENEKELYNIDPAMTLDQIIDDICHKFHVPERHKYSLLVGTKVKKYITDDSLRNSEIQNGNVICLGTAPERLAQYVIRKIEKLTDRREALMWLQRYSEDIVFNRQFVEKGGISQILQIIEIDEQQQNLLACILTMVLACIDDQLKEYREISEERPDFTDFLISRISRATDHGVLQRAFNLLERGLAESPDIMEKCRKLLTEETHIQARLSDQSKDTQLSALTFTNMIIHRMDEQEIVIGQTHLNKLRQIVLNSIVRQERSDGEMLAAVTTFQNLILSINYSTPLKTKGDQNDATQREIINQIKKNLEIDNWDKLSQSYKDEPLGEFYDCPPGILPLKCLSFFARRYKDRFRNLILNNSGKIGNTFPIVEAAKQTTLIIAAELQISGTPSSYSRDLTLSSTSLGQTTSGASLFELVLILEQSLEELFSQSLLTFIKTWEDMKATQSDFQKVAAVVKQQVQLSLTQTDRLDSLDKFRRNLLLNDYKMILEVRERKHKDEMMEESSQSVKKLKNHLREDIFEIVTEQRLQLIEQPKKFHDNPNKKKEFYAKLDKNRRQIWIDESGSDVFGDLKSCKSIQIREIKNILVGRDCPHLKDRKRRNIHRGNFINLAFSLQFHDDRQPVNFIAENHTEQTWWVDSLRCLLNPDQFEPSTQFNDDVDKLLNMKMKVQMIEFQDIEIPDLLPSIENLSAPPPDWL